MDGISILTTGLKRTGGSFADAAVTAGFLDAFGNALPQAINTARRILLLFARRTR